MHIIKTHLVKPPVIHKSHKIESVSLTSAARTLVLEQDNRLYCPEGTLVRGVQQPLRDLSQMRITHFNRYSFKANRVLFLSFSLWGNMSKVLLKNKKYNFHNCQTQTPASTFWLYSLIFLITCYTIFSSSCTSNAQIF